MGDKPKKAGRPRTVPIGEKPPSRSNKARRERARKRRNLPRRDKDRKKLLKNKEFEDKSQLGDGGAALDEDGLTVKERIYVESFLAYGSKRKARAAAGYAPGVNPETPIMLDIIKREMRERVEKFQLTSANVLEKLSWLVHFDPAELTRPDGSPKSLRELPIHIRYCVEGIDFDDIYEGRGEERRWIGKIVKWKLPTRIHQILAAMKHLKLLDGSGVQNKDRLDEVLKAFQMGPVKKLQPVIEGQTVETEKKDDSAESNKPDEQ